MPPTKGRKRRAQPEEEESPQSSPGPATQRVRTANEDSEDGDFGGGASHSATQGDHDEMVKKLVRLALASEYQRKPIRREDIREKVLGNHNRQFKEVFNQAQQRLRVVFGMEMVELPAKEKVTLQQRRAAKSASQAPKTTASWILTSILPSQFRDPEILAPDAAPALEDDDKYTAVYTLLVSLVSLSGGTLPDAKMERCLRRLNMEDNTPVAEFDKTEKLVKRLEKDGYIVRVKESTGTGEDDVYWMVGPRGKIEVGEDGVRGLTKAVFGEMETQEDEHELERKIARSLSMGQKPSNQQQQPSNGEPRKRGRPKRQPDREERDSGEDDAEESDDDE